MTRSFSQGTLLWVDDDLEQATWWDRGGDIDYWRQTFGNADGRVYRLLNLQLELALTADQAQQQALQLSRPDQADRFVVAVVDVRIPKREGEEAQVKYGLRVAQALRAKGVPVFFLSTQSIGTHHSKSSQRTLRDHGLEDVPFFQKLRKLDGRTDTQMPEHLVRQILSLFRDNVTWLDLQRVQPPDVSAQQSASVAIWQHVFPFFGPYRDFVERWEARSAGRHAGLTILRTPETHSDQFVQQCLAIQSASQFIGERSLMTYMTSRDRDFFQRLKDYDPPVSAEQALAIRFYADDVPRERLALREAIARLRNMALTIMIPQDERAFEYLAEAPRRFDVIHDDLPLTRLHDRTARLDLVFRVTQFALQRVRLPCGGSEELPLHTDFLSHPEVLIDPVFWRFICEADKVAEKLSDPYEILIEFGRVIDNLQAQLFTDDPKSARLADALRDGLPIPGEDLLRPAHDIFSQEDAHQRSIWIAEALRDWLLKSWRTPLGKVGAFDGGQDSSARLLAWQDHSFRIAIDLARQYLTTWASPRSTVHNLDHRPLREAALFLTQSAVAKLLDEQPTLEDWDGLESLRWPHATYPMPASLSRLLKRERRHFWVQTDQLDRATILRSGRRALDRLEARAERTSARLQSLRDLTPHLPLGWGEAVNDVLEALEQREIEKRWTDVNQRDRLWRTLRSVLYNAAPVSFLFYALVRNEGRIPREKLQLLKSSQGAGTLLGPIRGARAEVLGKVFAIREAQPRTWFEGIQETSALIKLLVGQLERIPQNKREEMTQSIVHIGKRMAGLEVEGLDELPMSALAERSEELLKDMLHFVSENEGFLKGEFFDNSFHPDVPSWSPLEFAGLRGLQEDLAHFQSVLGEHLHSVFQPVTHFDGYHLLAVLADLRNAFKDQGPKELSRQKLNIIFELFVAGYEGLAAQLQWVLRAAGHGDLVRDWPELRVAVTAPIIDAANGLAPAIKVTRGESAERFRVFLRGFPGTEAGKNFCCDVNGRTVLTYRGIETDSGE
jgi:hypothetical protein